MQRKPFNLQVIENVFKRKTLIFGIYYLDEVWLKGIPGNGELIESKTVEPYSCFFPIDGAVNCPLGVHHMYAQMYIN